jgi:putative flippase GtrA
MALKTPERLLAEGLRGARFLGVGCAGLATDSAIFTLLHGQGQGKAVARAVSLMIATLVTWGLNRAFTFRASGRTAGQELGRYGLVALGAQGFNYLLFLTLCAVSPGTAPIIMLLISAVCATAFSYSGQRFFTFAPQQG